MKRISLHILENALEIRRALASMAQLVGASSHNQKVAGSIPSQGTYLGCGLIPSMHMIAGPGVYGRQPIDATLSHKCFSISFPLSLKAMKICPQVRIKKSFISNYVTCD